eukprot:UN00057
MSRNEVKISFLDNKDHLTQTPPQGRQVAVHYTGYLTNGTKFDSSRDRGQPFRFPLGAGQVIRCWDQACQNIPYGRRAKIECPPHLAYGARGAGNVIPPNATLIFDVEVLPQNQQ